MRLRFGHRPRGCRTTALATAAGAVPDDRERTGTPPDVAAARIGDDDVRVLLWPGPDGRSEPVAVLSTPWIDQHLLLYARTLWHRRRAAAADGTVVRSDRDLRP